VFPVSHLPRLKSLLAVIMGAELPCSPSGCAAARASSSSCSGQPFSVASLAHAPKNASQYKQFLRTASAGLSLSAERKMASRLLSRIGGVSRPAHLTSLRQALASNSVQKALLGDSPSLQKTRKAALRELFGVGKRVGTE